VTRPDSRARRIRPRFPAAALAAGVSLVAAGCGGGSPHAGKPHAGKPSAASTTTTAPASPSRAVRPTGTIKAFVADWNKQDWRGMTAWVDHPPRSFVSQYKENYQDLNASHLKVTAGPARVHGRSASVPLKQSIVVTGGHRIKLQSTLDLRRSNDRWMVEWQPSTIDRQLMFPGEHLLTTTFLPARASITGAGGVPLASAAPEVEVGLVGSRLKDVPAVTKLLLAAGATRPEVTAAVKAAKANKTYFEPVFQVTEADFTNHIRGSKLYSISGTQFQPTSKFEPATQQLGTYLTGGIGPITAQELKQLGPGYSANAIVGQGGLEQEYQRQLAGAPGTEVQIVSSSGARAAVVAYFKATPGRPVQTSISLPIQKAAESAISTTTSPAALVAVNAKTGQVLAIANHDPSAAHNGYINYALDATEAPGSTFKTITSTALIADKHYQLNSPTTCPSSRTVDGETFQNDAGESFGNMTLLSAFAKSCNTAFIGMATSSLTGKQLVDAAKGYGLGRQPAMGFPAYGGNVPMPIDRADLASTSIGQGQITVSPLDMAMVASAIDSGVVRAPRLVAGAPDDHAPTRRVSPVVQSDLRQMMAAVVASGTAAGQGLPPGTFAKTGTAQFGGGSNPPTHAWLIGWRGNVAFACFVNIGVAGGAIAAPLVATFLKSIGTADGA